MNNKQTVRVKVLGKRISIKGSTQAKIATIFPELKKAQKLPYEPDLTKIEIINSNTYQILKPNQTFGSIVADGKSGVKSIQIRDKDEANRKKNIQFVQYDVLAEQAFSDVLTKIICGDYDVLFDLGVKRKISPDLQTLLAKICQKCKNSNEASQQKPKEDIPKIQKLEQQLNQQQQQIINLKYQIQQEQQKAQKLQKSILQPQKIKQKFKQAINKQQISQIIPNYEEQHENQNDQSILIVGELLKQVNNKFTYGWGKKINQKNNKGQNKQMKQQMKQWKKQEKKYDLLHHSRTFDIQVFGGKLGSYSQKLAQFVEGFVRNQIKQIVSVYFLKGPNIDQFISNIKQKNNFIMLFSSGPKLFGIFSSDTFGSKVKSESGFLFSLSDSKKYTLKPGNPIWKYSNVEIKIGSDSLIFSQQTKKDQMKMKIKKPLSDSFNIQKQEIRAMIGDKDPIIIDSFEFLTVNFVSQSKQQKKELKHQNRSLKTQASD